MKDKRCLSLRDTLLYFAVEIPYFLVPDNHFGNALFDAIDLYINHELVTSKSSNADNYLTDFILTKVWFDI